MNGASLPPLGPLNLEALRVLEGVAGTTRGALDPAAAKLIATLLESGPQGLLFQLADGRRFAAVARAVMGGWGAGIAVGRDVWPQA